MGYSRQIAGRTLPLFVALVATLLVVSYGAISFVTATEEPTSGASQLTEASSGPAADTAHKAAGGGTAPQQAQASFTADSSIFANTDGWYSWAVRDRATGKVTGSKNAALETNNTESMIKLWIGADWLAGMESEGLEPDADQQARISAMIRYSDNDAAQEMYEERGKDAVIERLISECALTGTYLTHDWWSYTQMTAYDATLMMSCILERAGNSPWTQWLISEAQNVSYDDSFGISRVLPADKLVTLKNGWTPHSDTGEWNLNCLASWDNLILAVETRYSVDFGQEHGDQICQKITAQVLASRN